MSVPFQPMDNRVLLLPDDPVAATPGGIYLPGNAQEKPRSGRVVAIGPGRWASGDNATFRVPMTVRVGDRVNYARLAAYEIEVKGVTYVILKEDDLLGKFVED